MTTTDPTTTRSDVQAALAADLMAKGAKVAHVQVDEEMQDFISVFTHRDVTHQLIDPEELVAKHRRNPARARGTIQARTLDGVGQAIARHRTADSPPVLYHDAETLQVTAVLNDHLGSVVPKGHPGWRDHRIHWTPTLTPEWKHWVDHQGLHDQLTFAEILEDGEAEIVDPPVADMLEIVTTLHSTRNAKYRAAGRPTTGVTQFLYEEQTDTRAGEKGDLTIPDVFYVVVRPFFGADAYKVKARIRYRTSDGNLKIGYQLHRPSDVIRQAFDTHVEQLIDQLDDVDTIEGLAGGSA
jgi:uncharacterized protein YfdQ (DUF2303 family)